MKHVLILLFAGAVTASAWAGNEYQSNGSGYSGYNAGTGSHWSEQSSGSESQGTDSHGNHWEYNRDSGTYHNDGTGVTRVHGKNE